MESDMEGPLEFHQSLFRFQINDAIKAARIEATKGLHIKIKRLEMRETDDEGWGIKTGNYNKKITAGREENWGRMRKVNFQCRLASPPLLPQAPEKMSFTSTMPSEICSRSSYQLLMLTRRRQRYPGRR